MLSSMFLFIDSIHMPKLDCLGMYNKYLPVSLLPKLFTGLERECHGRIWC